MRAVGILTIKSEIDAAWTGTDRGNANGFNVGIGCILNKLQDARQGPRERLTVGAFCWIAGCILKYVEYKF